MEQRNRSSLFCLFLGVDAALELKADIAQILGPLMPKYESEEILVCKSPQKLMLRQ